MPLLEEYAACRAVSNRRSTYYYEHILPDIQKDIEGHAVDIGLAILRQFNPPPPKECTDFITHFFCLVAVPPCDPETGLPMRICNESCMALDRLLGVDYCRDLDNYIRGIQQTSTFPDLRIIVDRYFEIDCFNTSTYIFEPSVTAFSNQSCTHLFTPYNLGSYISTVYYAMYTLPGVLIFQSKFYPDQGKDNYERVVHMQFAFKLIVLYIASAHHPVHLAASKFPLEYAAL